VRAPGTQPVSCYLNSGSVNDNMSGGSVTRLVLIAARTAEICPSIAQIQKLVELKDSSRASCAVCAEHRLLLPANSLVAQ